MKNGKNSRSDRVILSPKSRVFRGKQQDTFWGYFFIFPLTLGLIIFYVIPFFQSVYFSLCSVNQFNQKSFIGLQNFKEMLHDPEVGQASVNTLLYVLCVVPVALLLSIIVAALLNTRIRGTSLYRTLFFLPTVTMPAAIAIVWKWMYNGQYGILNSFLGLFGISGQNWLSNPTLALFMIMIVGIWSVIGYNMIILLAGMQGIPRDYYEAAAIDGAGGIKAFFKITVPLLSPSIFFVVITNVISAFQVFDIIYMMIGKSSVVYESTQSLIMLFYRNASDYGRKGYASAIAVYVFAIIMLVTVIQFRLQKKWVHYA